MNFLKFTHDKLNVETLTDLVSSPKCGAVSIFMGTTRDTFDDKTVLKLEYEAYETMALKTLEKVCEEMRTKWPQIANIAVYHRLGAVPVKEASIVIAVAAPHRADALHATEWCIDKVKECVPIWKKEVYAEAAPQWKQNKESPKPKKFKLETEPRVEAPHIPPHLIQIKAPNSDLNKRIENFMEMKRNEININNVREFCTSDCNCARVDAVLQKRKDSKGHLQVSRVLNTYHRDQTNSDYLTKYIPQNGVEERLQNLELQLSLTTPTPRDIYTRLKKLEERMLHLEAISPEYVNFWDKTKHTFVKKKVFSLEEIDSLITDLEQRVQDEKK
ncbi:molybdopterin synthase catalytic subunit [Tribolium madens]|uniref:molybdopterin synthase catalytic subunit n=1 Tax=Tribolium madens TaxID=41895 RepID=UPI001CF75BB1|nr:molybdopterin synthase catalytic subunit [Tribolium madens]